MGLALLWLLFTGFLCFSKMQKGLFEKIKQSRFFILLLWCDLLQLMLPDQFEELINVSKVCIEEQQQVTRL